MDDVLLFKEENTSVAHLLREAVMMFATEDGCRVHFVTSRLYLYDNRPLDSGYFASASVYFVPGDFQLKVVLNEAQGNAAASVLRQTTFSKSPPYRSPVFEAKMANAEPASGLHFCHLDLGDKKLYLFATDEEHPVILYQVIGNKFVLKWYHVDANGETEAAVPDISGIKVGLRNRIMGYHDLFCGKRKFVTFCLSPDACRENEKVISELAGDWRYFVGIRIKADEKGEKHLYFCFETVSEDLGSSREPDERLYAEDIFLKKIFHVGNTLIV